MWKKVIRIKLLLGFLQVLVAGIVVIAAILVSRQVKEKKYYTQLQNARIYITNMDYDSGVEAYKAAIEINPKAADAYIELAEAYIDMGIIRKQPILPNWEA